MNESARQGVLLLLLPICISLNRVLGSVILRSEGLFDLRQNRKKQATVSTTHQCQETGLGWTLVT